MKALEDGLDLHALCQEAEVTPRTVRYYIQRGLLPSPGRQGPGTRYGQGHLDRLRLIRALQQQHLPLAEIRKRLESLDDAEVAAMLAEAMGEPSEPSLPSASDALSYIRQLRGQAPVTPPERPGPSSPPRTPGPPDPRDAPFPQERAQWERLTLTEDIELHVRRPLSREHNRRLERLLEAARQILVPEQGPPS